MYYFLKKSLKKTGKRPREDEKASRKLFRRENAESPGRKTETTVLVAH